MSDGLRQLPTGKWQARYVGPGGRRYARTFARKTDASYWRTAELRLIELDTWTRPTSRTQGQAATPAAPTVSEWAADDIHQRTVRSRRPIKQTTADNYRKLLRLTVTGSPLGQMELTAVTRNDVEAWRNKLPSRSATQNGKAYELVASVFASAVHAGLITTSPCTLRGAGTPDRAREPQTMTAAEVDAYLAATPAKWRPALLLSVTCALRIGEVLALRERDLDLAAGTLTVRATVAKVVATDGTRQRVLQTPKTAAATRTVHLLPRTIPELERWRLGLGKRAADALLFPDSFGKPLNDDVLRRVHKKAATAIGRPELRNHDLRSTGATLSAQAGATVREIQSQLGHTTAAQALRYQTATLQRDAERAQRVSDAWG